MSKLYRSINVWQRSDCNTAILYRCFEIVGEGKFCVQSVDYYRLPLEERDLYELTKQSVELFIEDSPEERSPIASSIQEAIIKYHDFF